MAENNPRYHEEAQQLGRNRLLFSGRTDLVVAERNIFEESPAHASRVMLSSPVISPAKWRALMNLSSPGFERE